MWLELLFVKNIKICFAVASTPLCELLKNKYFNSEADLKEYIIAGSL